MTPNEETGRRFCMLSEFMLGKPVFESYKSLCSKIGDETISYQEFDFWFHRFAQGKLDLSYDRSLDPKAKEFSDMPVDVVDNILDHLSLLERLPVRNVSRDLRDLIDRRTTSVKKIRFTIFPCAFFVSIDNIHTEHIGSEVQSTVQKGHISTIEGPDAMKNALKHLAYYLRNPKLKLERFSISVAEFDGENGNRDNVTQCFRKLEVLLLSLEHQISTESFDCGYIPDTLFLVVLKSFKPGVLVEIRGDAQWDRFEVIDEILRTEQWKQAKRFISGGTMSAFAGGVAHFEELAMAWEDCDLKDVVRLKQLLLESKTFKIGELIIYFSGVNERDVASDLVEALGPRIFRYPESLLKWSYPIPDTNEFLDFYQDGNYFHIERTT